MCGIVGILGRGPVAEQLVDLLKRLEYRGYDSAGVATLEGDISTRRRAEGKLKNLEARLRGRAADGPHRDRTHALGHPRQADREQRASACDRARRRGSQRHHREFPRAARGAEEKGRGIQDRNRYRDRHCIWSTAISPRASIRSRRSRPRLPQLRGAFALGFIFAGDDDLLIGARNGPPLAIGYGDGEMYLGSDAIALGPFTDTSAISRTATGRC